MKGLAWPIVVLVAIFLFYKPVINQFEKGNISSVKAGLFELNMRTLPPVTDSKVASGLSGLPENEVVTLLFSAANGNSGYTECMGDLTESQFDAKFTQPFNDLASRGLATVKQSTRDKGVKCVDISLTSQGTDARKFIINLIAAQLSTAK
jgi:hypothetical protein